MKKSVSISPKVKSYLKDIEQISKLKTTKSYYKISVPEYPFDLQLLSNSHLYRASRIAYLKLGGIFSAKVCSMLRGLSTHDLFKNEIEYTPSMTEMIWFKDHYQDIHETNAQVNALSHFNQISIFHEQNHRIIWSLLPKAPKDKRSFCRYLNFSESLVVILDLAFGDELGKNNSLAGERLSLLYRPGGAPTAVLKSKQAYRQYLLSLFVTTYMLLEGVDRKDILKALDFILPDSKKINPLAKTRGLELSELFTLNTNPQWQNLNWKKSQVKLSQLNKGSKKALLNVPESPLDLSEANFELVIDILNYFGI